MGYPLAYQQQPRGLKISGVENAVTGSAGGSDTNAAFTAAAVAAMTNLGTWPITGASSWITVTTAATTGTTFTFLREGIYEVRYSIPFATTGAATLQAGIGYRLAGAQLALDPDPAVAGIMVSSQIIADATAMGGTLTGTASILVRKSDLAASAAVMNLLISNGADATPAAAAGVVVAQVTLWITQVNNLWG